MTDANIDRERHNPVRKLMLGALLCGAAVPALAAPGAPPWVAGKGVTLYANCAKDGSLAATVNRASPGDRIVVSGSCNEKVTVTTSHLTIDGLDAVLDGTGVSTADGLDGVLTVRGAQGVTIVGVTVTNSTGAGISVLDGASVHISDSHLDGNAGIGLLVQGSTANVADSTLSNNFIGADVINSSSLILGGAVTASGNGLDNLSIAGASTLELRGAQVLLENSFSGLTMLSGSRVVTWAFAASAGNTLTASGNVIGIALLNSDLTMYTPDTVIAANGNAEAGIYAVAGTVNCGFGYGSFDLQGNGAGLALTDNAGAALACNVNIASNGVGIFADGAGTVSLGPWDGTPPEAYTQTIQGNGVADVNLAFGTRMTAIGATIGTVVCDETVLSRGTTTCP